MFSRSDGKEYDYYLQEISKSLMKTQHMSWDCFTIYKYIKKDNFKDKNISFYFLTLYIYVYILNISTKNFRYTVIIRCSTIVIRINQSYLFSKSHWIWAKNIDCTPARTSLLKLNNHPLESLHTDIIANWKLRQTLVQT